KAMAIQLALPEMPPKVPFGVCHIAPQSAREIAFLTFAHPCAPDWCPDRNSVASPRVRCKRVFRAPIRPSGTFPRKRGKEQLAADSPLLSSPLLVLRPPL